MSVLPEWWNLKRRPLAERENMVRGDRYRFTALTPRLVRMEYSVGGVFEDRATQRVLNRDFPPVDFTVVDSGGVLVIQTENMRILYDKRRFSPQGLSVNCTGGFINKPWRYGDECGTLGGTARTLDEADGAVPLEPGLLSRQGFTVLDDRSSLALTDEGWVEPRPEGVIDLYFFGYGRDYKACLKDFFRLSGAVPLLPRYVFGNWWSRYHKYTESTYKALIERFEAEKLPFSVSVVDMDWHLVDIDPKYGSGWTGYTWNRDFFPDPPAFLSWLHEHGLRVTLNVHPAEGIRAHEEYYGRVAERLGVDAKAETPIPFDCCDPEFMRAYFEEINRRLEDEGVDFWWIDWQQGTAAKISGLDPLWMLNHYYYLDSLCRGKRPLIVSRYAGIGSHRYPVGFSGDTIATWDSLRFQPYFTAVASNAGYGWWSHDIGGHMHGIHDDEMMIRWVQFGVFSPVNRFHSTASRFNAKEPWRFGAQAEKITGDFLRLRHRLIPYLYSMNRRASREGEPLIQPLYYEEPYREEAYRIPNEYYFGTEMLCCPITTPLDKTARAASFRAWIPGGLWFDFFTGASYSGGRMLDLWRSLDHFPVLIKAGGIVPLANWREFTNSVDNPQALEVVVCAGASGSFTLWEDDGEAPEDTGDAWAETLLTLDWGNSAFTIAPVSGNTAVVPAVRDWTVRFLGFTGEAPFAAVDGKPASAEAVYDEERAALTVRLGAVPSSSRISLAFKQPRIAPNDTERRAFQFLQKTQMEFDLMEAVFQVIKSRSSPAVALASLSALDTPPPVFSALCEILTAR
jgi:alpha-glucosidase (family GH31 glycosyl hydrolase)